MQSTAVSSFSITAFAAQVIPEKTLSHVCLGAEPFLQQKKLVSCLQTLCLSRTVDDLNHDNKKSADVKVNNECFTARNPKEFSETT